MKTFQIKKEKWYHSNSIIYLNEKQVGLFIPGVWSSTYTVILGEKEIVVKKKMIIGEDLLIYANHILVAEVKNFPFKNQSIISDANTHYRYILKANTWNSKYILSNEAGINGEYVQKTFTSTFCVEDHIDDYLIAATIVQTYLTNETITFVAVFVPLFVILIS